MLRFGDTWQDGAWTQDRNSPETPAHTAKQANQDGRNGQDFRENSYECKVWLDLRVFYPFGVIAAIFLGRWGILNTSAIRFGYRCADFSASVCA